MGAWPRGARQEIPRSGVPSAYLIESDKRRRGNGVSDQGSDDRQSTQFHYHLELTPVQLKITHTALRSLLDDFGHEERDVVRIINEVLQKLPDQHAIRAIQLEREVERQLSSGDGTGDEPPPVAA